MKEYWVNVWKEPIVAKQASTIYGPPHNSVNSAINSNKRAYEKKQIAYRIHVKMKEPKFRYEELPQSLSYSKHERLLKQTPTSKHWMGD